MTKKKKESILIDDISNMHYPLLLKIIVHSHAQGCTGKFLGEVGFEVGSCVGKVGKHYGVGFGVGI